MAQVEIPRRSLAAKHAMSTLFQEKNDIDIYIEDTAFGYEKLFTLLLSRIFKGKYRIKKIFPLGSRGQVIKKYQNEFSNRPYLYIVDGDLFLLTGDTVNNEKGFYRLPFYCIENILCDSNAIIEILDEEEPTQSIQDIKNSFDYLNWIEINKNKLFELFIEYAISMVLNPQQQTVHYKVSNLVQCNKGIVNETKLQSRINEIKQSVLSVASVGEYDNTRIDVLKRFESSSLTEFDIISGKDYLFPLLKTRAKSIVKTSVSDINFKQRLAKKCDFSKISDIVDYVAFNEPF